MALKNLITSFLVLMVTAMSCSQDVDKKAKPVQAHDTTYASPVLMPNQVALRAFDEDAINEAKNYKYYLLYLEHRPWHLSSCFSLRMRDEVLYSYTKYMDNVVSTCYPPMYYKENRDSIFYSSRYQEHYLNVLDTIRKLTRDIKFKQIKSDEKSFERIHDSRWLIIIDSSGHSIYNWRKMDVVEQKLVRYIKDSLMQFSPDLEDSFHRDGEGFKNHIPQF
jgi:hypothetical protein